MDIQITGFRPVSNVPVHIAKAPCISIGGVLHRWICYREPDWRLVREDVLYLYFENNLKI